MPNLIPPKIPDGERVDFDVSDTIQYLLCMGFYILVYYVQVSGWSRHVFTALSKPAFNLGPKTNMCISIT